ncbi:MAG: hypothetical protein COB67_05890 [SAR324 cluster bacterium]|uniref:Metallo-beta-lactamase domain-containing protein n=1 Tax=SAR324 cluster bacterium TaxID=2024889 RepID=A0A2A4T5N0_9DELT|nr:MAG: hypothetical protein COB67_05890 [SAR324 cluster bacterium]
MELILINYSKKIPPIGQGGFIVQKIYIKNKETQIIYDCGTKSAEIKIISEIKKLNTQIDTILIISHFHADHINKISELKANMIKVVKVIIPKVHKNDLVLLASNCDDNLVSKFIYNPQLVFEHAEVVYIENNEENIPILENVRSKGFLTSNLNGTINHNSSCQVIDNDAQWLVRFYVDSHTYTGLTGAELKTVEAIDTIDDLIDQKVNLREIYDNISKKDPNKTNMMMFIYPNYNKYYHRYRYRHTKSLIMCTGDMKIDSSDKALQIKNHFLDLIYLVTDMMLPHHGSNKYFDFNPFRCLIRAYAQTEKVKHGHPGDDTIKKLELEGIEFYNIS